MPGFIVWRVISPKGLSLVLGLSGILPICLANSELLGCMGLTWAEVVSMDMGLAKFGVGLLFSVHMGLM